MKHKRITTRTPQAASWGHTYDTLVCEHPSCHAVGMLMTERLWPCGDVIEYVRCAAHGLLDSVQVARS